MLSNRIRPFAATVVTLALITVQGLAQHEMYHGPPRIDPNGYTADLSHPFIEPLAFNPDWEFFAPAGVDQLGGAVAPSFGWFATYDRTYLYASRPQDEESSTQGDFGWGNRFEVGYMSPDDHGWQFTFLDIDGPNSTRILVAERINVLNEDDEINGIPGSAGLRTGGNVGGGGQQQQQTPIPGFPLRDRNNPITNARDYLVNDSYNIVSVSGFELNKTFRLDPLHYGSVIEPFLGFRYNAVNDKFLHDVYERFDSTTGALVYSTDIPGLFPPATADPDDFSVEEFRNTFTRFDNNMFGAQIGARWFKQKGRWNLSGELRAFAVQNFQTFTRTTTTERTFYDGGTPGSDVDIVLYDQTQVSANRSEFVFGGEIRAEAAYNVTRSVQLRTGIQFMDYGRGIGRGNDPNRNDQDFLMVGATGGFTINR